MKRTCLLAEWVSDLFKPCGIGRTRFQIYKVDREHAFVLAHGGGEAIAPVTLGTMVRDPDGNRIELSQRASIVGSLEAST